MSQTEGCSLGAFLADLVARNLEGVLSATPPESVAGPVKAMPTASIAESRGMDQQARDALLAQCMPVVQRIASRYARYTPLHTAEDLYHTGVLAILEKYETLSPEIREPGRYLIVCARYAIVEAAVHAARPEEAHVSLDAPLSDQERTLLDVLPFEAPASRQEDSPRTLALHEALHRIPTHHQLALKLYHHLPLVVTQVKPRSGAHLLDPRPSQNALYCRRSDAYRLLRKDPALREAVLNA